MQNLEEKTTKKQQLQNVIKFVVHDSEMSLCLAHLSQMLLKQAYSTGLVIVLKLEWTQYPQKISDVMVKMGLLVRTCLRSFRQRES